MPSASSRRERAASFDRIASRRATRGGAASLHALPLLLPPARAFECWKPVVSSASPLAYYIYSLYFHHLTLVLTDGQLNSNNVKKERFSTVYRVPYRLMRHSLRLDEISKYLIKISWDMDDCHPWCSSRVFGSDLFAELWTCFLCRRHKQR